MGSESGDAAKERSSSPELETDEEGAIERSSEDLPLGEDLSERVGRRDVGLGDDLERIWVARV